MSCRPDSPEVDRNVSRSYVGRLQEAACRDDNECPGENQALSAELRSRLNFKGLV